MKKETFWTSAALAGRAACQLLLTFGAVTILSPEQAGLWFLFVSLGSIVQFFDLGFSAAVLRCASYLHSGAQELLPHGVSPLRTLNNTPNIPQLKSLLATVGTLYGLIGLLVLLLGAGLSHTVLLPLLAQGGGDLAWALFCVGLVPQLLISLNHNFLQGAGSLPKAQALMALGTVSVGAASYAALAFTHSLSAFCATYAIGSFLHYLCYLIALRRYSFGSPSFSLLKILWPNSIRSGVSRLSLAMIYHLPTLLIGRLLNVGLAGSYGLSVQICLFASSLAQLPIMAAAPRFYALAGSLDLASLRELVCAKMRLMLRLLVFFGLCILFVAPWLLELIGAKTTLLPLPLLAGLVLFFALENHRNNHVLLVGAFNRFPFWKADIATGLTLLAGGAFILPSAGLPWFLVWMFICAGASVFWWPVAQGLKAIALPLKNYTRALLSFR